MKHKLVVLCALAVLVPASAFAELRHVEIKTLGMDWEICAHAVRVAMQKVDGVQAVRVSLRDGLTILDLKPDNAVTLAKLRQIIKDNGFVSKEATATARGDIIRPMTFVVSGTREELQLASEPRQSGENWGISVPAPAR